MIQAKNTIFNFDNTVNKFDNLYFQRLSMAKDSNLMSLCPQMKAMGHSHFWEPGSEWKTHSDHWQVLIDTDISTTIHEATMDIVREYASEQGRFFSQFTNAFIKVSELGYEDDNLHHVSEPTSCTDSAQKFKVGTRRRSCGWASRNNCLGRKKKNVDSHCPLTCDPINASCDRYVVDSKRRFYVDNNLVRCSSFRNEDTKTLCSDARISSTCRYLCRMYTY